MLITVQAIGRRILFWYGWISGCSNIKRNLYAWNKSPHWCCRYKKNVGAIWDKISYQTRYSVKLDTPKLIIKCTEALGDLNQYPKVVPPKVRASKAKIVMGMDGVHGVHTGIAEDSLDGYTVSVPDVYAYIQNRVHLSHSTIFSILDGSGRLAE
ncbi:hypothetical protein [Polynucleobacter sinensis]|uniref:hypothetical protein n=1 Tax=Polynucleobacter sinensis TaxID=1743157 RepID=UPI0012E7D296|nr:hypothetical protein [Polynucleobacter sinensis]